MVEARLRDVTIALSVNGRRVLLDVVSSVSTELYPGALFPPFRGAALLAFESRDCSGPPFLFEHPDRLLDAGHVGPPGLTLHLPAVPAVAVVDLLTLFTPPFRLLVVE